MNRTMQNVETPISDSRRRWLLAASISSIISAFIASICCVGPLAFALLGIGGAGLLVTFVPYRPYFMAVTFALLGAGFYFTYRKPKAVAGATATGSPECACPAPRANRAGKVVLWSATVLVVLFLAFPYLAPLLFR
jgi:mercuric ion transport protein